jgi:hypothetical protein
LAEAVLKVIVEKIRGNEGVHDRQEVRKNICQSS